MTNELVAQISSNPHKEDIGDQQADLGQRSDRIVDVEKKNLLLIPMNNMRRGHESRRTIFSASSSTTKNDHDNIPSDQACENINERKIVRKDIERQRRQQMTFLASSLRSLLPLEMIKGKRSVSDHVQEAVNYITHLKNEIEDLTIKRDTMRYLCCSSSTSETIDRQSETTNYSEICSPKSVIVSTCLGGIEIVISGHIFPLSRVLEILVEQGLDIVSCASTKVNQRLIIHTIHSEVDDLSSTNLDLSELQQKLNVILWSTSH